MSLSKSLAVCKICESNDSKYVCPKCDIRYCSSECYRAPAHEKCSEMFFQQWVTSTLKDQSFDISDRRKMIEILKRSYSEQEEEADDLALEDRFADLDLESDDLDESLLWDRLTDGEKEDFKKLVNSGESLDNIVSIKTPWWSFKRPQLVTTSDSEEIVLKRPSLPINIASLKSVTSQKPSPNIPYNIINVLYAYVFIMKLHNFDVRDFIEEGVDLLLQTSPVLSQRKCYSSLDETMQDCIRMVTNTSFQIPLLPAKSLCYDVCSIIDGPSNTTNNCYVLCALNDVKSLIVQTRNIMKIQKKKDEKRTLFHAIKKLDYFLSWIVDYYGSDLKPLSSQLRLKYLPEILMDNCEEIATDIPSNAMPPKKLNKPLIEELN